MFPLPVSYFLCTFLYGEVDLVVALYGDVGLSSVLKAKVLPLLGDLPLDSLLGLLAMEPW